MVFDTRAIASFRDLAGLIGGYATPSAAGEYTTPSAGESQASIRPLAQEEADQACRLRKEYGWHTSHITQALGLSDGRTSSSYVPPIFEAIVGCTTRGGWGGAEIDARKPRPTLAEGPLRDIQNLRGRAARDRLTEEEATLEGTNRFGELRTNARANAVIEAALAPERQSFYGRGARKAGYKKNTAELAADADIIITEQKHEGHYPGINFGPIPANIIRNIIQQLTGTGLFIWEGREHGLGIQELLAEEFAKVKAELIRRLREQEKLTPERPPRGSLQKMQDEIYKTFKCCGLDGTETMEEFGYSPFTPGFASRTSAENNIFKVRQKGKEALQSAIDDPANQAAVRKIISDSAATRPNVSRIMTTTGLSLMTVNGILVKLGYEVAGTRKGGFGDTVRAIILPLHDNQELTPAEIWRASPELQKLLSTPGFSEEKNFHNGTTRIGSFLRDSSPPRLPWTRQRKRAQRRSPLVVERLRAGIVGFVNSMESQQSFGRLYLAVPSVQDLAASMNETESLVTEAIQLLLAEPAPIIQMIDGVVQVPGFTQLRIQRGDVSRWEFSAN
jgi:hypothetical protein